MSKSLKAHKSAILNVIEENLTRLESHLDIIIGNETTGVEPCRTAKTGKTAKRHKPN